MESNSLPSSSSQPLTDEQRKTLVTIFTTQFLDFKKIYQMGGIPNPDSFVKKNSANYLKKHPTQSFSNINFVPDQDLTELEYELLQVTKESTINIQLIEILDFLADKFSSILQKSSKEGLSFSSEMEQKQVMSQFLTNGLNKFWTMMLQERLFQKNKKLSSSKELLANPQNLSPDYENLLSGTCISGLVNNGFGLECPLVSKKIMKKAFSDLELLQLEGKFNRMPQSLAPSHEHSHTRTDRIYDFSIETMKDDPDFTHLFKIGQQMIMIPFELNKWHHQLLLQMTDRFIVSYFSGKRDFINELQDSGRGKQDNGMKTTVLLFVGPVQKKSLMGTIRFKSKDKEQQFQIEPNQCFVVSSRDCSYSIKEVRTQLFMMKMLIAGPQ